MLTVKCMYFAKSELYSFMRVWLCTRAVFTLRYMAHTCGPIAHMVLLMILEVGGLNFVSPHFGCVWIRIGFSVICGLILMGH